MANGGEDIEHFAFRRSCVAHAIGGDHGQAERGRDSERRLVPPFLFALAVPV